MEINFPNKGFPPEGPNEGADGQPRLAEPSQSKPNGFASSPKGGAFCHLLVRTDKAPSERTDFPRPGENVTAGDKRGNLASSKAR